MKKHVLSWKNDRFAIYKKMWNLYINTLMWMYEMTTLNMDYDYGA